MDLTMSPAVATYFSADDSTDIDAFEACFTRDAVVQDEGKTMHGLVAIKAWKLAAKAKYQYHVKPLSASPDGASETILALVAGSFPGSPVKLTFHFDLVGGKIASLAIR